VVRLHVLLLEVPPDAAPVGGGKLLLLLITLLNAIWGASTWANTAGWPASPSIASVIRFRSAHSAAARCTRC